MDGAAGAVSGKAGEGEALGNDALPRERGVAVQEDRKHRLAVLVLPDGHDGAHLAEHDRVDRLEVRRVRKQ